MTTPKEHFRAQDFLTLPLETAKKPPDLFPQELLLSHDGSRRIWTRYISDLLGVPHGILALTVGGHNLLSVRVTYRNNQVALQSVGVGAASDPDELILVRDEWWIPRTIYTLSTREEHSGWWWVGASVGPYRDRGEFIAVVDQGFLPLSVIEQPIDPRATAQEFTRQIDAFMQEPASFEPRVTPRIDPVLAPRRY